ncbi:MAG: Vps62-related protein [Deltaproteobacteria bacterium]|nr:Vps62-related protein [Deltaproteobacteria bacterium]
MSFALRVIALASWLGLTVVFGCSGLSDNDVPSNSVNDADSDTRADASTIDGDLDGNTETEDAESDADGGEAGRVALNLSTISIGVFPQGHENLDIDARDEQGNSDTWSARSMDETIATVSQAGSQLTVNGLATGDTSVRITSAAGMERDIDVRVYDPYIFETEELLIKYVDEFIWRWDDSGSGGKYDGNFWHPVVPEGWHALGSFGVQGYGDPTHDHWMIVVKEKDGAEALSSPVGYQMEYDDSGSGATADGSFWTPICPAGFVALGAVAQSGYGTPNLNDVTCVRENLTVAGQAGSMIWIDEDTGADDWVGMWRINIKQREDLSDTRLYLDAGTFVARGRSGGNCSNRECWSPPAGYSHMRVLAVDAPMLFDAGNSISPHLTSYTEPSGPTEPFESRAMLVPFSAVLNGSQLQGKVHSFVTESPLLRFEKIVRFHRLNWIQCGGSTECALTYDVEKGFEATKSETFSVSVGISVTAEAGISFKGVGGSVSVTVNTEFGYETTESRSAFTAETWSAEKPCPPEHACAIWTDNTTFLVKKHLSSGGFAILSGGELTFDGGLSFWTDEYSADEE